MKSSSLPQAELVAKTAFKRICTHMQKGATPNAAIATERQFLRFLEFFERFESWYALRSGPPWGPSHQKVIIDITLDCNLRCSDCNRSVGSKQTIAEEHMTPAQIRHFVAESVDQRRRWFEISIEGGEPTLHPQLIEIVEILIDYQEAHSPWTNIKLQTNGVSKESNVVIETLRRKGVDVYNSGKTSLNQSRHCAFNMAPIDDPELQSNDFSEGCHLPCQYGLGLTQHGYYPHPVCGGIDRIFGFNIGRKTLPELGDSMTEQFKALCRYCGFFTFSRQLKEGHVDFEFRGTMSKTWQQAYAAYQVQPPVLDQYT